MKKKREMTDHEYEMYRKTHGHAYPTDVEERKIRRERFYYGEHRRKSDQEMKRRLRDIARSGSLELLGEEEFFDAHEVRARREIRNAKSHKKRFKGLEARER